MVSLEQTIDRRQHTWLSALLSRQTFWVCLAVALACLYMALATDTFLTANNLYNITLNFTFTAIIALGMTLVIITGGIDLSVGSVLCLCSMILGVIMNGNIELSFSLPGNPDIVLFGPVLICADGCSIYTGVFFSLLTAIAVGLFNGVMVAYVGMPPFVVTLGMLSIARSLAMVASNNTVVSSFGPDQAVLFELGSGSTFGISNPFFFMVVLMLLTGYVLRFTSFGRHVFAIGGNEAAATLTGVPVRRVKVAVYVVCAIATGICAIIETGWLGAVTTNIGTGMELQVIAAAVIGGANLAGGVGTAFGAIVGAALIEIIRNSLGLLGINAFWQGTFIGGAIVLAVLFDRIKNFRQSE